MPKCSVTNLVYLISCWWYLSARTYIRMYGKKYTMSMSTDFGAHRSHLEVTWFLVISLCSDTGGKVTLLCILAFGGSENGHFPFYVRWPSSKLGIPYIWLNFVNFAAIFLSGQGRNNAFLLPWALCWWIICLQLWNFCFHSLGFPWVPKFVLDIRIYKCMLHMWLQAAIYSHALVFYSPFLFNYDYLGNKYSYLFLFCSRHYMDSLFSPSMWNLFV